MTISLKTPDWSLRIARAIRQQLSVPLLITAVTLALSIMATFWAYQNDVIVAYGDAESHLNIAKRVVHSTTPGMTQLGGIWLPIPHILMIPFVYFDPLWRTGLAGSIVSGLSYIIASIYIYRTMKLLTKHEAASVIATAVFAFNPNILYLQSTPMSELPLLMFFTLSTYYFIRFLQDDSDIYAFVTAGFFGFCATLSRYDGWFLVLFQGLIIVLMYLRRKTQWHQIIGKGVLYGSISLFGILLWILWGYIILGDPLYFTNSEFSAKSQQEAWKERGQLPAYHNLGQSILYYTVTAASNSGFLIFFAAVVGFIVFIKQSKDARLRYMALILAVPFIFNVLTLFIGQSVIFIPHVTPIGFDWRLFNVRYGVMLMPLVALSLGFLWIAVSQRGKWVILSLVAIQYALFFQGFSPVLSYADGVEGLSKAKRPDAEQWLAKNYDEGLVLMDDFARSISILRSGVPMQNTIYIGNKPYWEESLNEPDRHARWIIAQQNDTVWRELIDNPEKAGRLYTFFEKVYTSPEVLIFRRIDNKLSESIGSENETGTFWKHQCIDTMKSSRDRAQELLKNPELSKQVIAAEVDLVAESGANCIAISTPYDAEFLPFLNQWVAAARSKGLHVWFRGNFSAWEGWFGRKKGMTEIEHLTAMQGFITDNPELFRNGDIFTGAPEAENGGPFTGRSTTEFPAYRNFLVAQKQTADTAFQQIGKNVVTNWFSMNGWIAENMYDQTTVDQTGNHLTIDHYVKTSEQMDEFINMLNAKFNAKVSLGEFGAPIPDLNGNLTEAEQANLIEELLRVAFKHRDIMVGINYWTLNDGTTALTNSDYSTRSAYDVIRDYYQPSMVEGNVRDHYGRPIERADVALFDGLVTVKTTRNGYFAARIPAGISSVSVQADKYLTHSQQLTVDRNSTVRLEVELESAEKNIFDKLWLWGRAVVN